MKNSVFRRVSALLLVMVMTVGLCACGGKDEAEAPVVTASPVATPKPTPVPIPQPTPEPTPEPIVGEVLTDDDGDGIINYEFYYNGSTVYAMIVLDPSRVYLGTAVADQPGWGGFGLTLDVLAQQYGAIAGINAGGFLDEGGAGSGWPPSGTTYSRGVDYTVMEFGPIAGLDTNNKMWVGYYTNADCNAVGIRDAVAFGPALVENGVRIESEYFSSGIGARTAIGQREDGAIVMVVVDGRQGYSIGITFDELTDIMVEKFGCINASNMDGGNSSCMYFNGQAVNRSSNQAGGTRYLPDAWLVNPLPTDYTKPETVPEFVVLPENPLGEIKEHASQCDPETSDRMYQFACTFLEAYYGYFGTKNADYYYPTVLQFVAEGSDLRDRIDQALQDRMWVNTWKTTASNIVLNGVYSNGDGTYDIIVTSDIFEQATYWNYEAPGTTLRITVVEAPDSAFGYLVTATY